MGKYHNKFNQVGKKYQKMGERLMMMSYKLTIVSILILFVFITNFTFADGFHQQEQSAVATAQGGAVVARAKNLSAIYFNPAGIAQLAGTQISFGGNLMLPSTSFSNLEGKWHMIEQVVHPTNVYISHQLSEKINLGVGYYRPFAYSSKWESDFVGRFVSKDFSFKTYYFTGAAAYQATPEISIGFSISYIHAKVIMSHSIDLSSFSDYYPQRIDPEGLSQFDSTANNFGISVGFLYKFDEFWTLGATYRSATDFDFSGNFNFIIPESSADAQANTALNELFPDQSGFMSLKMPQVLVVGLSTTLIDRTTIEANIQWSGWSTFQDLPINYSKNTTALEDKIIDRQWKNTFAIRLGAEIEYKPNILLRGGYRYDNSAIPGETFDPMIPDVLKQSFCGGVGIKWNKIDIDVAYAAVFSEKREEDNIFLSGTYESFSHIFALSISFKF